MTDGSLTVRQLVEGATHVLAEAGVASPRVDAVALASHLLARPLVLAPERVTAEFQTRFAELVERRRRREPLQHILGETGFRRLIVKVEPGVFIPRPETEIVAQWAIDEAARTERPVLVVDLCCGSGAIGLAVADEAPNTRVICVDLNPQAVKLTGTNRDLCGVPTERLQPVVGDICDPGLLAELSGTIDIVVANPPYIPPDQEPLDQEVRDHDPDLALYGGGEDGLKLPQAVIRAAVRLLAPGGLLIMEHAEVQDASVRGLVGATESFDAIRTEPDLTGRPRMVVARRW